MSRPGWTSTSREVDLYAEPEPVIMTAQPQAARRGAQLWDADFCLNLWADFCLNLNYEPVITLDENGFTQKNKQNTSQPFY